jgi:heme/copper-type cytochrome/quinol oxidase subunit 2
MAGPLADIFFWCGVALTTMAQVFIVRSTMRGMRAATVQMRGAIEWVWAILPILSLVAVFVFTWRAMHPNKLTFTVPAERIAPIVQL